MVPSSWHNQYGYPAAHLIVGSVRKVGGHKPFAVCSPESKAVYSARKQYRKTPLVSVPLHANRRPFSEIASDKRARSASFLHRKTENDPTVFANISYGRVLRRCRS